MSKTDHLHPESVADGRVGGLAARRELAQEFLNRRPVDQKLVGQASATPAVRQRVDDGGGEELAAPAKNRQLMLERDILSKAAAWFARETTRSHRRVPVR